jgi:CDP-6-deoxy-D-xylo-4-hexulose-3-dehydrase
MEVPRLRVLYAEAVYGQEEIDAVIDVLENSPHALMTGERVAQFEGSVASLFGKTHGVMVNSGSSANTIAVASLGAEPGAEVITPALTFSTTVAPLLQAGLVPAFVDVEPDTFNIDAEGVEAMVGPRTRAIMVPNLIGNLPDWAALGDIADRYELTIIEDSADTIGSTYRGAPTGSLTDISTTSFYASHVITAAGFGGMVTSNDSDVVTEARLLRGWGRVSSLRNESERAEDRFGVEVDGLPYDAKFLFTGVGHNFLPSEISAAFGLVQLGRLEEYGERRRQNFRLLDDYFSDFEEWFILPRQNPEAVTSWLAFPLIIRGSAPFDRRELQVAFEEAGVQTRVIFTGNILRQPGFRHMARRENDAGYPDADRVMAAGLLLGCHHGMTHEQLDHVVGTFAAFARQR